MLQNNLHYLYLPILILFLLQQLIWFITALISEHDKPKTKKRTFQGIFERLLISILFSIVCFQLLGISFFSFFPKKNEFIWGGYIIYLYGMIISLLGRKEIHTNWTGSYDYQIKEKHSLVTSGIYKYIRHPIYAGYGIMISGIQFLVQSLFIFGIPFLFYVLYVWAKREEHLLEQSFGKKYLEYKKRTTMFFPFLF